MGSDPERLGHDRDLRSVPEDECRMLLARQRIGRVVFVDSRGPVALPVNYVVDHRDIVFRTSSIHATPATGSVGFEVDEIDSGTRTGWSILVTGTVAAVDDPADVAHVTMLHPRPWARGPRDHYFRLTVKMITGRRLVFDDDGVTSS
jgi:nitroimidazol reductase NimA-like FMN-containing flavoprotein (pyridoxamine 5'-phosphate oxidase superfamily)